MNDTDNQPEQTELLSTEVDQSLYEEILKQNNFAGKTISEVLAAIASIADANTEKGAKFEKLAQWALPLIKALEIEHVIDRPGPDIGVDLIATNQSGEKIAIQCKFYTARTIAWGDISTFVGAAKQEGIKEKWLVCGGKGLSRNIDTAKPGFSDIKIVDLRQYSETVLTTKKRELREPLALQQEAIDAVVQGFKNAKPGKHGERRGQLIMACGTGKTFTALRIAEEVVPSNANILFIAPSIALVAQARNEWLDHSARKLRTLIICSDKTSGHDEDIQTNEIAGQVTTAPEEIAAVLNEKIADGAARATFCTYQSLDKLIAAQHEHGAPEFDLAIIDEAHRTTGLMKEGEDGGQFLLIHDATKIRADKRLYMTATPRIYKDSAARRKVEKDPSINIVDMSDRETYGNEFHNISFKSAVEAEILCDYRVIALGVTESIIGPQLTNSLIALNDEIAGGLTTRRSRKAAAADAQSVLALGAISLAINGFIRGKSHPGPIARTIAYANSILRSKWLERALQESQMKSWVTRAGRRDGSETARAMTIDARHLDGTSSAVDRHKALNWLGDGSESSPRLITNAQLFTEGVDVPALNAIAFLDPRKSKIDTVQAVGRVMRRDPHNPNKVVGYIIVPVIMRPGKNLLETLRTDKARFQSLGNVLQALRSHDPRFDTDLHVVLGEVVPADPTGDSPPEEDLVIQESLLDDETKDALFAQLAQNTGIGNAGKNTADDITIAINRAAPILEDAGATQLIADTIGTPADNAEESCKTAALLIANACIMHKRLDETGNLGNLAKIETANNDANPPEALHRAWVTILAKDYSPIFQDAAVLVKRMVPLSAMHDAIHILIECAMDCAATLNDLGFDHAGHLYHRVLGTAQSDGAYYTKNLSAYLLAGLAFDDDFVDWKDADAVKQLRVADPACGTGTLLMAALKRIKDKAAKAQNLNAKQIEELHKHLVENSIYGFDINAYSIQLAACNLTIGAPNTDYSGMNLHTLLHGSLPNAAGEKPHEVRHGALEMLFGKMDSVQLRVADDPDEMFSTNVERKKQQFRAPENLDVVIYNPPFTDTSKAGARYSDAVKKSMDVRLGQIKEHLQDHDRAAADSIGKMSIGPFFTPLTTKLLSRDNGKLAKIIPATACTSENGRAERQYIASNFHIEIVVTSHDPKHINFSENTNIHECLVVGSRGTGYAKPTRFIQLSSYPNNVKDVDALIDAIRGGENRGGGVYAETLWPAEKVRAGDWTPVQWMNGALPLAIERIKAHPDLKSGVNCKWSSTPEMFYSAFTAPELANDGDANVIGSISENLMQTMFVTSPTHISYVKDNKQKLADKMRSDAKRAAIVCNFSTTSTRVMAIYNNQPTICSRFRSFDVGDEDVAKATVTFLNSSFGVLQMLNLRSRKLSYARYKPSQLKTLRLPNPDKIDLAPLLDAFKQVKDTPLGRLRDCTTDPARRILDHAAAKSIGVDPAITDQWREWLSQEPTITNRPYNPKR